MADGGMREPWIKGRMERDQENGQVPQDREEGEVKAARDNAIGEILDIIEDFQNDNPKHPHLVLDILESVGKLAIPGYSVQIITSPVGTGQW